MKKTGLFGGTFNPIHIGHAVLAERVYSYFNLDEMVFIPSKLPPHKDTPGTTVEERYEMVELTAKALGRGFSVSDYEIRSDGISYTHRTVSHCRREHPDDALFFITGTDIFITIGKWQEWEDLFNQCNFIVVNRTGTEFAEVLETIPPVLKNKVINAEDYADELYGRIILFTMDPVDVSSTEIRDQIADAEKPEMLLDEIRKYIEKRQLYK